MISEDDRVYLNTGYTTAADYEHAQEQLAAARARHQATLAQIAAAQERLAAAVRKLAQ